MSLIFAITFTQVAGQLDTTPSCTIYVLLDKKKQPAEGLIWRIHSSQGFVIRDLINESRSDTLTEQTLELELQNGRLLINKRKGPKQVIIEPIAGESSFGECSYVGSLHILHKDNTWYLVNGVELEDYVYSVLGSESWPGWPLEINKVLAIIFRSYAVAKRIEARSKRKLGRDFFYDVLNTNMHQTYKGSHTHHILRQAVNDTKGMVLAHNHKPILAMYDACCGGIIPADIVGVDFTHTPYLARTYACTFCEQSCSYTWSATYTFAEMINFIKSYDQHVTSIQHVQITNKDKAGIVHEVVVRAGKKKIKISGKKTYSLFKDIKSYSFSIDKQNNNYIFTGKGYGHHLGLCQWGARELVKRGWICTNILNFYYPGTRIMKIAIS
jgi:stage II sporulation protein D